MNPLLLASMALAWQGFHIPEQHLPAPPAGDTVVARVNGSPIKASDMEAILWDWRGYEVLQDLISLRLVDDEARRIGVTPSEIEVLKVVDDQLRSIKANLTKEQDLQSALRERGFPQSRLYMRVKMDLSLDRISEKLFRPAEYVKASTMLFKAKTPAVADLVEARARAQAAFDRLRKGEKWEDVLKSTQEVQGILANNGRIGWRRIDDFPTGVRLELATAHAGTITKPAETGAGVQLFRVDVPGAGVSGQDLEELRKSYFATAKLDILERLRKDAKIEQVRRAR